MARTARVLQSRLQYTLPRRQGNVEQDASKRQKEPNACVDDEPTRWTLHLFDLHNAMSWQ